VAIPFVELRGHSEMSLGYACGRLTDWVERAKELGHPAIGFCERDSIRGVHKLHKAATTAQIRPIYGVEIAVVADRRRLTLTEEETAAALGGVEGTSKRERDRAMAREARRLGLDRSPMVCLRAMNDQGLGNLFRIVSSGWAEGLYNPTKHARPRVDLEVLARYADGVSLSVGGLDGYAIADLLRGRVREGIADLDRLAEVFAGRTFLEVHPHAGDLHKKVNTAVRSIAASRGLPVIATNDPRYVLPSDVRVHTVVLCLEAGRRFRGKSVTLDDPEHPESQAGYHLRSGDEMAAAFAADHPDLPAEWVREVVARTAEFAETHQAKAPIDPLRVALPDLGLKRAPDVEIRAICRKGWEWRKIPERAARLGIPVERYAAQLVHELKEIGGRKFDPYFLIVRGMIDWARSQGIAVGPGRGSAAGSLVCYLLGITSIDPLEHGLMFERFLAPGRIDMPDIDTDFQQSRRDDVIAHLRERYGDDRVAHIVTFGQMHGRGALKDVARIMGVPFGTVNAITAQFSTKQGDEKIAVREVLSTTDVGRAFMHEHADALEVVERLEGSVRQLGIHASGIIVTPWPLSEGCPVEYHPRRGGQRIACSAIDMNAVSDFGILKLDVLGLSNHDVLASVRDAVRERHGTELDFEALEYDDPEVINAFTRQEFTGVFQYDAASARNVCADLVFAGFGDIAVLTALNRPGGTRSGLAEMFRLRRQDPSEITPLHPIYDEITADTLGVIVYQEQVIRIFRDLGGFSPEKADKMRKIMGKKLGEAEFRLYFEPFQEGARANGMPDEQSEALFKSIGKFAEYGFNRAHAAAYAAVAYWEMWAKVHYPEEFVWALMRHAKDSDEAVAYVAEAKRLGVAILGPDVQESGAQWTITDAGIRAGVGTVKHVGKKAVGAIVAGQPFSSPSDFFTKVPGKLANWKTVDSLIKAGAMRSLLPNTRYALERKDWRDAVKKKKEGWEKQVDALVAASAERADYGETDLMALALSVAPQSAGVHPLDLYRELFHGPPAETTALAVVGLEEPSEASGGLLGPMPWLPLGETFWEHEDGSVVGVVTDVKFRVVGDFEGKGKTKAEEMSAHEREIKGIGRRFAQTTIQDRDGNERKIKIEPDVFDRFAPLLKVGAVLAFHVDVLAAYHSARAHYVADLESIRQKVRLSIPLSPWERCFTADHPVMKYSRKRLDRRPRSFEGTVLITHVRRTLDRSKMEMAFFGIQDGYGLYGESVCFRDDWEAHGSLIVPGAILSLALRQQRRKSYVLNEEGVTAELEILPSLVQN
jgi:DNA polymerase-3 subunit alpha